MRLLLFSSRVLSVLATLTLAMTIRPAVASDVPEIVRMAAAFATQSGYADHIHLSADHVAGLAAQLIDSDDGVIFVAQSRAGDMTGMIALLAFVHPMSGERIASELVWWVDPAHRGTVGVRLLRTAEGWARDQGAAAVQMIAPTARVGAFYESVGYRQVEVAYQMRLPT